MSADPTTHQAIALGAPYSGGPPASSWSLAIGPSGFRLLLSPLLLLVAVLVYAALALGLVLFLHARRGVRKHRSAAVDGEDQEQEQDAGEGTREKKGRDQQKQQQQQHGRRRTSGGYAAVERSGRLSTAEVREQAMRELQLRGGKAKGLLAQSGAKGGYNPASAPSRRTSTTSATAVSPNMAVWVPELPAADLATIEEGGQQLSGSRREELRREEKDAYNGSPTKDSTPLLAAGNPNGGSPVRPGYPLGMLEPLSGRNKRKPPPTFVLSPANKQRNQRAGASAGASPASSYHTTVSPGLPQLASVKIDAAQFPPGHPSLHQLAALEVEEQRRLDAIRRREMTLANRAHAMRRSQHDLTSLAGSPASYSRSPATRTRALPPVPHISIDEEHEHEEGEDEDLLAPGSNLLGLSRSPAPHFAGHEERPPPQLLSPERRYRTLPPLPASRSGASGIVVASGHHPRLTSTGSGMSISTSLGRGTDLRRSRSGRALPLPSHDSIGRIGKRHRISSRTEIFTPPMLSGATMLPSIYAPASTPAPYEAAAYDPAPYKPVVQAPPQPQAERSIRTSAPPPLRPLRTQAEQYPSPYRSTLPTIVSAVGSDDGRSPVERGLGLSLSTAPAPPPQRLDVVRPSSSAINAADFARSDSLLEAINVAAVYLDTSSVSPTSATSPASPYGARVSPVSRTAPSGRGDRATPPPSADPRRTTPRRSVPARRRARRAARRSRPGAPRSPASSPRAPTRPLCSVDPSLYPLRPPRSHSCSSSSASQERVRARTRPAALALTRRARRDRGQIAESARRPRLLFLLPFASHYLSAHFCIQPHTLSARFPATHPYLYRDHPPQPLCSNSCPFLFFTVICLAKRLMACVQDASPCTLAGSR